MTNPGRQATVMGIAANSGLFALKFLAGMMTGSLALLSDSLNSFADTAYSVAVFIAVGVSHQKPDKEHPFGHHRAEPVAALIIAILAGILGFEIIKEGFMGLFASQAHIFSIFGITALLTSMAVKSGMWAYFKRVAKRLDSPAISASSVDSRNDVLVSLVALLGFSGPAMGLPNLDFYASILIGAFIIWSGYEIGSKNIDYLMGSSPGSKKLKEIREKVESIEGVLGIHDTRAHFVGNYLHVQIHIEVDKDLHTDKAHEIGKRVETAVEGIPSVDKAFVHIDPK